jgi:pilus assembly protein Flp/PilA
MLELFVKLQNRFAEIRNEEGATAVEYGIMVALIAVGIIVSVEGLRDALIRTFDAVAAKMP